MASDPTGSHPSSSIGALFVKLWRGAGLGMLLALAVAVPASAHAVLVETDPVDGAHLDQAPSVARLVFNEPVQVPVAAVRVYDSSGARVDRGDAGHGANPDELVVSIPELGAGSYVVTWRAVSADGHPVKGAFVFQVGHASEIDESLVEALLGGGRDTPFAVAGWLLRWLTYAGALVAAGGIGFLFLVGRDQRRRLQRLLSRAAVVAVAGSVLQIPVLAAESTGLGFSAFVSAPALGDALESSVGFAALVRIAAAVLVWLAVGRSLSWWAGVGAFGVVIAELVTGHTRSTEPVWLVLGRRCHPRLRGCALGGWVGLPRVVNESCTSKRRPCRWGLARGEVFDLGVLVGDGARCSRVGSRVGGGARPRALTSTTYGWTLLAKTGIAARRAGSGRLQQPCPGASTHQARHFWVRVEASTGNGRHDRCRRTSFRLANAPQDSAHGTRRPRIGPGDNCAACQSAAGSGGGRSLGALFNGRRLRPRTAQPGRRP